MLTSWLFFREMQCVFSLFLGAVIASDAILYFSSKSPLIHLVFFPVPCFGIRTVVLYA